MDYTDEELDDLRRLRDLREQLRAMAEETVAAMKDLPKPETWADAGRKLRTLATADKLVTGMFSPPPLPRQARKSEPKPRPPKPEPSPFMKSVDDIERESKQILAAQKALIDDMPDDMEFPPELVEALTAAENITFDPKATSEDRVFSMAKVIREATVAKAVHRLKAMDPDNAASIEARLQAARRSSTAVGRVLDAPP